MLHTRDYANFCVDQFGFFLPHDPKGDADGPVLDDESLETQVTAQLSFIHDVLGEETLRAWYEEGRFAGKK